MMKNYLKNYCIKIVLASAILCVRAESTDSQFSLLPWKEIETEAQNAVVQVWSQKAEFNWLEPYKSPKQYEAAGSGFFINNKGDLLTNFHVISQAQFVYINVPLCGRKPLPVQIKGVCPEIDVALVALTDESYDYLSNVFDGEIPYLKLGNSDNLFRTEPVLALGFPMMQRYIKSTVGVIAGGDYSHGVSYIHITAPINPGNSGGPLLNLKGEVIGINSAGIPKSQNIGYIRPINDVKNVFNELQKLELYKKPEIGIIVNPVTDELAKYLNNPVPGGVYVNYVYKNSLAERAGIKTGDMLYEIIWNGNLYKIDQYGDLNVEWRTSDKISLGEFVNRFKHLDPFTLIIYRLGEKIEINSIFDTSIDYSFRPVYPEYEAEEVDYEIFGGGVFMQLRPNHEEILPLPAQNYLKKYYYPEFSDEENIIFTSILPGSQIHKVDCFNVGMIVDELNCVKVKNINQLREALMLSAQTGTIVLKTKEGVLTVLSIDKVLEEESKLAYGYIFPISETLLKIAQLRNKSVIS